MSEIIKGTDPGVMDRCRSGKIAWAELLAPDREVYEHVYARLEEIGRAAIALTHGRYPFELSLTSGFSLKSGVRGSLPKDLWIAVHRRNAALGMPQLYMIVSGRGVEYGFAAAIHTGDFSTPSYKEKVRALVPVLFRSFPDPNSDLITQISSKLSSGNWFFRQKTRQDPGGNDFANFQQLVTFLRSDRGKKWGAGAACRYATPEDLSHGGLDLREAFLEASEIFAPLLASVFVPGESLPDLEIPRVGDETITHNPMNGSAPTPSQVRNKTWMIAAGRNAEHWEELYRNGLIAVGWDEIGPLDSFETQEQIENRMVAVYGGDTRPSNDARTCFDFVNTVQEGDVVFVKRGRSVIIGKGIVTGPYLRDEQRVVLQNTRSVRWEKRGEWVLPDSIGLAIKTLTDISQNQELLDALDKIIGQDGRPEPASPLPLPLKPFDIEEALRDVFLPRQQFEDMRRVWRDKKNLVLKGAPGVGKTFIAKRLSYALMGYQDDSRVEMVQFHQSYSYEDFVQGYRPFSGGFRLSSTLANSCGVGERIRHAVPDMAWNFDSVSVRP
jgi:hypothetical protein